MKKILFLLMLLSVNALAGQWPIITSVRVEVGYTPPGNTSGNWDYYITQALVDVGHNESEQVYSGKYIMLSHKHYEQVGDTTASVGAPQAQISTDGTSTAGQLAVQLYYNGGSNVSKVEHSQMDKTLVNSECIGYFIVPTSYNPSWDSAITPGGCLNVPPANEWCKITTPEIVLDHGVITLKQAEGNVASTSVSTYCTSATSVTFNLATGGGYVYLDDGKSEVKINNLPPNSKIQLPSGYSQVEIKDTLTGLTKEGYHMGSSVLVMMPY